MHPFWNCVWSSLEVFCRDRYEQACANDRQESSAEVGSKSPFTLLNSNRLLLMEHGYTTGSGFIIAPSSANSNRTQGEKPMAKEARTRRMLKRYLCTPWRIRLVEAGGHRRESCQEPWIAAVINMKKGH